MRTRALLPVALMLILLVVLAAPSTQARETAAAQTAGLLAHWRLNGNTGTVAVDSSGNGRDGMIVNAYDAKDRPVASGNDNSLEFPGDGYIETQVFDLNNDFSFVMWIDPSQFNSRAFIGKHTDDAENQFLFGFYQGGYYLEMQGESTSSGVPMSGWQQLILVGEENQMGTAVTLYRNGRLLWQRQFQTVAGDMSGGRAWTVGRDWDREGDNDFFLGKMADIRIYDSALSAAEIADLTEPGLVAQWKLDEGSGNAAGDSSGNLHHGAISNGAWSDDVPPGSGLSKSLRLEGNGYIDVGTFDLDDNFTIAAWSKVDDFDGRTLIAKHTSGGQNQFIFGYFSGQHAVNIQEKNFGAGVPRTSWNHLVLVAEAVDSGGTEVTLYRNGVAQWANRLSTRLLYVDGGKPWTIGRDIDPPAESNDFFKGNLADIRIYDRAMTAAQVQELGLQYARICAVPSAGFPTIQGAVEDPDCDIVDVGPGTFFPQYMFPKQGIILRGAGREQTILDGTDGPAPLMRIDNRIVIEDLALKNFGGPNSIDGALVVQAAGHALLQRLAFSNNRARDGGAVRSSVTLHVRDTLFDSNEAIYNGGAIHNTGVLSVENSTFKNGLAYHGAGIYSRSTVPVRVSGSNFMGNTSKNGGALYSDETPTVITDAIFDNNSTQATGGAAIHTSYSDLQLSRSQVTNNKTVEIGGGLFLYGGLVTISDSTLSGNESPYSGGAIYANIVDMTIERSTLSGNLAGTANNATSAASALYSTSSRVSILNSTISGNHTGEGIYGLGTAILQEGSDSRLLVWQSTVADNDQMKPYDVHGIWIFEGNAEIYNSLLGNNGETNCRFESQQPPALGTVADDGTCGNTIVSDALHLGPLADNGGWTQTQAITADSAANNAGDLDFCLYRDQRWVLRDPEGCDAGSFELVDGRGVFLPVVIR